MLDLPALDRGDDFVRHAHHRIAAETDGDRLIRPVLTEAGGSAWSSMSPAVAATPTR